MINTFANNSAYLGAKWVLRLIHNRGLQVRNVLRVVHQGTGKQHLVVLLDNKSYVCDYAMGMNLGIPCRHYFSVLTSVREFRFHISVVRSRSVAAPPIPPIQSLTYPLPALFPISADSFLTICKTTIRDHHVGLDQRFGLAALNFSVGLKFSNHLSLNLPQLESKI